MARIDEALASVEKPEVLTAVLKATGAGHRKVPGFNPDMFWVSLKLIKIDALLSECLFNKSCS